MGAVLLFIHILAAGAWIGANVTQLVVTPSMQKTGGTAAAAWMRQTVRMGTRIFTPAALILLVTGILLVIDEDVYEFEQVFVVIGVLMVIIGAVLGMRVFGPQGKKAAELHESGDQSAAAAVHRKLTSFAILDMALLIFTVWAMVKRLGL